MHIHHTTPTHTIKAVYNKRAPEDVGVPTPTTDIQSQSLKPEEKEKYTTYIYIYLGNFIYVLQEDPTKHAQMLRHFFSVINKVIQPNNPK